jgi:hypothetical protein
LDADEARLLPSFRTGKRTVTDKKVTDLLLPLPVARGGGIILKRNSTLRGAYIDIAQELNLKVDIRRICSRFGGNQARRIGGLAHAARIP